MRLVQELVDQAAERARARGGRLLVGVPGETRAVDGSGVTIVEGINVLQTDEARARFGLALYVDADPEHVTLGMKVRLATYSLGTDEAGTEAMGFGFEPAA
jgi:hypothetical protein